MARAAGKRSAAVNLDRVAKHKIKARAEVNNPRGDHKDKAGRADGRHLKVTLVVRLWHVARRASAHAEIAAAAKVHVATRCQAIPRTRALGCRPQTTKALAIASIRDRKSARIFAEMSSRISLLPVKLAAMQAIAPEMCPILPVTRAKNRLEKIRAAVSAAIFAVVVVAIVAPGAAPARVVRVARVEKAAVGAPRVVETPAEIAGAMKVAVIRAGAVKEISKG